jgi:O-antigen/teichoic acid export membrane protein
MIRMVIGFAVAFVGAVIFYGLALISFGNLGDVRLVSLGPDPLLSASLLWILLSVGIAPAAGLPAKTFMRKRQAKIVIVPDADPEEVHRDHE